MLITMIGYKKGRCTMQFSDFADSDHQKKIILKLYKPPN